MGKIFLYTSITILYLLTPVCFLGIAGTMVSLKYEVEQSYWLVESNYHLSSDQRIKELEELHQRGRQLKMEANGLGVFAVVTFAAATILVVKRKKILGKNHTNH